MGNLFFLNCLVNNGISAFNCFQNKKKRVVSATASHFCWCKLCDPLAANNSYTRCQPVYCVCSWFVIWMNLFSKKKTLSDAPPGHLTALPASLNMHNWKMVRNCGWLIAAWDQSPCSPSLSHMKESQSFHWPLAQRWAAFIKTVKPAVPLRAALLTIVS